MISNETSYFIISILITLYAAYTLFKDNNQDIIVGECINALLFSKNIPESIRLNPLYKGCAYIVRARIIKKMK